MIEENGLNLERTDGSDQNLSMIIPRGPRRFKGKGYYDSERIFPFRSKGLEFYDEWREDSTEYHLPFHNYAGPGTHIAERVARGDKPVSGVDASALVHDIEYLTGEQKRADSNMVSNLLKKYPFTPMIPLTAKGGFMAKDLVGYNPQTSRSKAAELKAEVIRAGLLRDYPDITFDDKILPEVFGENAKGASDDWRVL